MLLCDDEAEVEQISDDRLLKWIADIFGRFHHADWQKEGFDQSFPPNLALRGEDPAAHRR